MTIATTTPTVRERELGDQPSLRERMVSTERHCRPRPAPPRLTQPCRPPSYRTTSYPDCVTADDSSTDCSTVPSGMVAGYTQVRYQLRHAKVDLRIDTADPLRTGQVEICDHSIRVLSTLRYRSFTRYLTLLWHHTVPVPVLLVAVAGSNAGTPSLSHGRTDAGSYARAHNHTDASANAGALRQIPVARADAGARTLSHERTAAIPHGCAPTHALFCTYHTGPVHAAVGAPFTSPVAAPVSAPVAAASSSSHPNAISLVCTERRDGCPELSSHLHPSADPQPPTDLGPDGEVFRWSIVVSRRPVSR